MRGVWCVSLALLLSLSSLPLNVEAAIETNSYPGSEITVYQWDELVLSGVLEPDVDTIGRVCSEDCSDGNHDASDFWLMNVTYGSSLNLDFESLHDPDYVNLDVDFCYSESFPPYSSINDITCRDWFDTDELEADSSSPPRRSNVFGLVYLLVTSVPGWMGDDSRYSMNLEALSNVQDEPYIIGSEDFGANPPNYLYGNEVLYDEVCWYDCFIYDEMDIYSFDLVKGDEVEITVSGTYSSWPQAYDRGYVSFWAMSESSLWDWDTYTVFTMNEQDSKTVTGTAPHTQTYFVKIFVNKNSNEGDNYGYRLDLSINSFNRNTSIDSDLDGYSDHQEFVCGGDWETWASRPLDLDLDYICDGIDSDIDGDGWENVADLFPYDSSEHSDFDDDGKGDNFDLDDDNDGWLDEEERLCWPSSDPKDPFSLPHDEDGDNICDSMDSDDDNDGYSDSVEEFFGTDPYNSQEFPEDMDGDFIPDEIDSDRDGDGWLNQDELNCGSNDNSSFSFPGDLDEDFICDEIDSDRDGDGWLNQDELNCGSDDNASFSFPDDLDEDFICDEFDEDIDGDGWPNSEETYCFGGTIASLSALLYPTDFDQDRICDHIDTDDDNDGIKDQNDFYPYNPYSSFDGDGDGFPDIVNADLTFRYMTGLDSESYLLPPDRCPEEPSTQPYNSSYLGTSFPGCPDGHTPPDYCTWDCGFDSHFTFLGVSLSEKPGDDGGDVSLTFLVILILATIPLLYQGLSTTVLLRQMKAGNHAVRKRAGNDFKNYRKGGKSYVKGWGNIFLIAISGFLINLFLIGELALGYVTGAILLVFLHPGYFSIPEHLAGLFTEISENISASAKVDAKTKTDAKAKADAIAMIFANHETKPNTPPLPSWGSPTLQIPNNPKSVNQDTDLLPPPQQKRDPALSKDSKMGYKGLPVLARTALSVVYFDKKSKLVYKEANNDKSQAILSNEVRVLRALYKKNRYFDLLHIPDGSNQSKQNPLLVMRYVGEFSLNDVLDELSANDRMAIARAFFQNVKKIHAAGYVHRDLKPENIMINKTGFGGHVYASIIDFGLARPVGKSQESFAGGTRPYSPNSQYDVDVNTHPAMDWYAFARVLIVLFGKFSVQSLDAGLQDGKYVDLLPELKKAGYTAKAANSIGSFIEFATRHKSDSLENQSELSKRARDVNNHI